MTPFSVLTHLKKKKAVKHGAIVVKVVALPRRGVHVQDNRRIGIDFAVADGGESGLDRRADHEAEGLEEREERGVLRPLLHGRHLRDVRASGGVDR